MDIEKVRPVLFDKLNLELPANLFYHSVDHVRDVLQETTRIAQNEGVSGTDMILLQTAALFHDSGFISQSRDHEKISCDIARNTLPSYGYNEESMEKICGMIMATKIPQNPGNLLEEIICDADLDYLGRDDYWKISDFLYREIKTTSKLDEEGWLKLQVSFLEQHQYFTKTSILGRSPAKAEHLAQIKLHLVKIHS